MSGGQGIRLGHVPALDGVRGLAVLLVMAGHADIPGFEAGGGYTGVTVFFVLSGFLITTILLGEFDRAGSVDIGRFYLRRGLRLLPALIVYVGVISVLTFGTKPDVIEDAAASLFYVANWVRAAGERMEYLDHIWSLSIEEQFYLVWPVALVLLLAVARRRPLVLAAGLLGLAALVVVERIALWTGPASVSRLYFSTDTRADGLLVGCALALIWSTGRLQVSSWLMVPAGLALILLPSIRPGASFLMLWVTTLSAIATAIVIAGLVTRPNEWSPFATRPLVYVGRISYGLYLWHFAFMLAFYGPLSLVVPAYIRIPILFAGSFALAIASYYIVERPFLRLKDWLGAGRPETASSELAVHHEGAAGRPDREVRDVKRSEVLPPA